MTVLASYDFNGQADATDVETYEPNFDKTFNATAIGRISDAGRFYGTDAISNALYYLNSLSPPDDCVIIADVHIQSINTSNRMALYGRMTPGLNANAYRVNIQTVPSNTIRWQLWKLVNNVETQLGSDYDLTPVSAGASFNTKLKMQGTTISVLVDDVVQISVTDSAHSSGSAGFGNIASSTSANTLGPQLNNWSAEDLASATTRGMPFGGRGSAFNGGRTFAGIIR